MTSREVDRFFGHLDQELSREAEIIITGAAAGSLMGHIRPSVDIDFEIRLNSSGPNMAARMAEAIEKTIRKTAIAAQYAEHIDRWNAVSLLNYRETATPYKIFGKLTVKLIAPEYWTIGKMTRYLPLDTDDVEKIIKKHNLNWQNLAELWGKALRSSMLSDGCRDFRDNVIQFLRTRGPFIWRGEFNPEKAVAKFKEHAHIKT